MGVDDDFWDDLLGHIRDQALVPVVGPDVTVVEAGNQTLTTLIGQRLVERYHLTVSRGTVTMGQAVAAFLRERGRDDVGELYRRIKDIIEELDPAPGDALRNLAAITDLRPFVSTTPDRLLAQAVNEVRFHGKPEAREITFSPSQSTSEQSRTAQADEAADAVVLRLFGQAASTPQYAIHEEHRLGWLHAFLSEAASLPRWLTYRLWGQPMLFVGCEFPDWMGRFFLRMSSNPRPFQEGKQFFFVGSSTAHEPSLSNFLAIYCGKAQVQQRETAPSDFAAELLARREKWKRRAASRDDDNDAPVLPVATRRRSSSLTCVRMQPMPGGWSKRSPGSAGTCGWMCNGYARGMHGSVRRWTRSAKLSACSSRSSQRTPSAASKAKFSGSGRQQSKNSRADFPGKVDSPENMLWVYFFPKVLILKLN
jgi:hypothetical protein